MRWVKRIEPITLFQQSDIPYIILSRGVFLCFDNLYRSSNESFTDTGEDNSIEFKCDQNAVSRQSSNLHKFHDFPFLVNFENIIRLNDIIIEGKLIKREIDQNKETKPIAIIKEKYLRKLSDDRFQEFAETLSDFDESFILVRDEISTNARLLSDIAKPIFHSNWGRTCVSIADQLATTSQRKYCWTKSVPSLEITTFGFRSEEDTEIMYEMFTGIGVEISTAWGG